MDWICNVVEVVCDTIFVAGAAIFVCRRIHEEVL